MHRTEAYRRALALQARVTAIPVNDPKRNRCATIAQNAITEAMQGLPETPEGICHPSIAIALARAERWTRKGETA